MKHHGMPSSFEASCLNRYLPAFDTLSAVALPAFDTLPLAILFIMLPTEVMLPDLVELPL